MSLVKRQKTGEALSSSLETDSYSLEGHQGTVLASKFSADGTIAATGGIDKRLLLWNLPHASNTDTPPNYAEITGHKAAITSIRWMDNGNLATSSADFTVGIWDAETGCRTRKFAHHTLVVNECDQDDNLVASASDDGKVLVWDQRSSGFVNSFTTEYPLLTVAFHDSIVFTSGIEPVIRAWDRRSPSSTLFEIETQHTDSITSLSVDDNNLISLGMDDTVRLYDPAPVRGNHIRNNVYDGAIAGNEKLTIRAIVKDNFVISGSSDNTTTVWDLSSKRLLRKLSGHTGTVIDVDKHEGNILSSSVDGTVILNYA